jgi:hypothetical protein
MTTTAKSGCSSVQLQKSLIEEGRSNGNLCTKIKLEESVVLSALHSSATFNTLLGQVSVSEKTNVYLHHLLGNRTVGPITSGC